MQHGNKEIECVPRLWSHFFAKLIITLFFSLILDGNCRAMAKLVFSLKGRLYYPKVFDWWRIWCVCYGLWRQKEGSGTLSCKESLATLDFTLLRSLEFFDRQIYFGYVFALLLGHIEFRHFKLRYDFHSLVINFLGILILNEKLYKFTSLFLWIQFFVLPGCWWLILCEFVSHSVKHVSGLKICLNLFICLILDIELLDDEHDFSKSWEIILKSYDLKSRNNCKVHSIFSFFFFLIWYCHFRNLTLSFSKARQFYQWGSIMFCLPLFACVCVLERGGVERTKIIRWLYH